MQKTKNTYKKSGVNINLADQFVTHIAKISKKNDKKKNKYLNKDNIGAFGSTFDISKIKIKDPLIVSSTDGVGTKIHLANQFNKFDTIGIDLVDAQISRVVDNALVFSIPRINVSVNCVMANVNLSIRVPLVERSLRAVKNLKE